MYSKGSIIKYNYLHPLSPRKRGTGGRGKIKCWGFIHRLAQWDCSSKLKDGSRVPVTSHRNIIRKFCSQSPGKVTKSSLEWGFRATQNTLISKNNCQTSTSDSKYFENRQKYCPSVLPIDLNNSQSIRNKSLITSTSVSLFDVG